MQTASDKIRKNADEIYDAEAAWQELHAELKLMSLTDEQVECCQIIAKYLGTSNRKVQVPRAMEGE